MSERREDSSIVGNLETVMDGINPSLSESQRKRFTHAFQALVKYTIEKGYLPPSSFRPVGGESGINDENSTTYMSLQSWGRFGRDGWITWINFNESNMNLPISVVAIVKSETLVFSGLQKTKVTLSSRSRYRSNVADARNQAPRFR